MQVATGELARPEGGPYDLVVSEGAVAQIPPAWFRVLAPQGRVAVVVRNGPVGKATLYTEAGAAFGAREVFDATPPWLPGLAPRPAFVF